MVSTARTTAVEVQRVAAYRTGPEGKLDAITNVLAKAKSWLGSLLPRPSFSPSFA